jgi:opacity protein-like surface antigen
MHKTLSMLAVMAALAVLASLAHAADGDRLTLNPDQLPWARWQGRLSLGTTTDAWRPGLEGTRLSSASLMGDYYFGRSLVGPGSAGGFRATSGLIFGPRALLTSTGQPNLSAGHSFSIGSRLFGQTALPSTNDTAGDNATLPYVGVGYTGLSGAGGWSFSADFGLLAQAPGGLKLVRSQSLDDAVREMRLAPLVQFGVSYAF